MVAIEEDEKDFKKREELKEKGITEDEVDRKKREEQKEKKISFKMNMKFAPDVARGLTAAYIKENVECSFIVHLDKPGSSKICAYESGFGTWPHPCSPI